MVLEDDVFGCVSVCGVSVCVYARVHVHERYVRNSFTSPEKDFFFYTYDVITWEK